MDKKNISEDRKKYLKKIIMNKVMIFLTQISILVILIILWEVLANKGLIDSFITSQPSRIVKTLINLSSNDLFKHIGTTCIETIAGFSIGTICGIGIAIILWWSDFLSKVSEPFLVVLNSLPKVALRTSNYNMGRSWHTSNYSYGIVNFSYCYCIRNTKWIFKYR